MDNKVNELSGKEWLKNAINFWEYDSNDLQKLSERFKSFCYKKRATGLIYNNLTNNNLEPNEYDFGFFKVDNYSESLEYTFLAAKSGYSSYHVFCLENEIVDNILLPELIYDCCIHYGMEFRGRIICWDKKKNTFLICILFLNRIERIISTRYEPHLNLIKCNLEESYVIESRSKMDPIGLKHPAPFSYIDISKICEINDIRNKIVLDPFLGVGSTIIGCYEFNKCIGIELNKDYVDLIPARFELLNLPEEAKKSTIICGDSFKELPKLKSFDCVITSPPYFNILKNKTTGVRTDGNQSRQGVEYYSDSNNDIGNIQEYDAYLNAMKKMFEECYKKMSIDGEFYLVISDFTVNKKEKNVHSDMVSIMNEAGFSYAGTSYIRQNQKVIYPFGYPFKIVLNHIFQYVIKFKKYE